MIREFLELMNVCFVILLERTLDICFLNVGFLEIFGLEFYGQIMWVEGHSLGQTREVSWFTKKTGRKTLLARVRKTAMAASIYTIGIIWFFSNIPFLQKMYLGKLEK